MINRLEVRNFRCFNTLSLSGLKRLNLVVGDSGSGKTAFLETLFLLSSGSPESYFRLRRWRGFAEGPLEFNGMKDSFESLFLFLFHNGDKEAIARISFIDSLEGRRSLDIAFHSQESLSVDLSKSENSVRITPITFKWDVGNRVTNITLEVKDGTIRGVGNAQTYPLHFISSKNLSSRFDVQLFSALSRSMNIQKVTSAIQESFPNIMGLSLEFSAGEPLIHAEVKGFREKVPVSELSGGLNKFISIALAIANNQNGVVCIDEIENGFYYRHHQSIVRRLLDLCDQYNVQMFASTHSWEFLKAARDAVSESPEKFCLLRTQYENNECEIKKIDGSLAISAIEDQVEVRG